MPNILLTTPAKPIMVSEVSDAATRVIGSPSKHLGGYARSSVLLTPAKSTIASIKPRPEPRPLVIASRKV